MNQNNSARYRNSRTTRGRPSNRPNNRLNNRLPLYRQLPQTRQLSFTIDFKTDSDGNIGLVKTLNLSMLKEHMDWESLRNLHLQYRILHYRIRYVSYNINSICLLSGVVSPIIAATYSQIVQLPGHQVFPSGQSTALHYNNSKDTAINTYSFFNEEPKFLIYATIRSISAAQANFLLGAIEFTFTIQLRGTR